MVLVSDILYSYISFLQTKLRYREGHEARRGGLETIPLDQDVKGRHGAGEPGVNIRPTPMPHLLHMADEHAFKVWSAVGCCLQGAALADSDAAGRPRDVQAAQRL